MPKRGQDSAAVDRCEIRFDVLAVLCPQDGPVTVEHAQGAF